MRSEWHWFVHCDLQIFSGCVCHLEQLHAQSPFLFPIVFGISKVQSQTDRPVKTVWKNFVVKLVKKSIKVAQLRWFSMQRCTAYNWPFFKLCSSFFLENWSQERIAGKSPNLAQLLINTLFPTDAKDYWNLDSFLFFTAFFQKIAQFCKTRNVYSQGNKKKNPQHLFVDPRILFMFQQL